MKYFRMSFEEVVYQRSYINLILLNRAIPGYKPFNETSDSGAHNNKKNPDTQHANTFFESLM